MTTLYICQSGRIATIDPERGLRLISISQHLRERGGGWGGYRRAIQSGETYIIERLAYRPNSKPQLIGEGRDSVLCVDLSTVLAMIAAAGGELTDRQLLTCFDSDDCATIIADMKQVANRHAAFEALLDA